MDEAAVERALAFLGQHGLVEDKAGDVTGTRKWAAHLQAAAEKINLLAASTRERPVGSPIVLAVSHALANLNLTTDDELYRDCVAVLVTIELSRMTPEKREQMGFSGSLK